MDRTRILYKIDSDGNGYFTLALPNQGFTWSNSETHSLTIAVNETYRGK